MKRYLFLILISFLSFAQQTHKVDFISCNALVVPNQVDKSISGDIEYIFEVLKSIDTIKIDAVNMEFNNVKINNTIVKYKNSGKALELFEGFKSGKNKLEFSYKASPKQALYFNGEGANLQIWTQGQGKYTSHWLPSFDDVNEKVVFDISIKFDDEFTLITNGQFVNANHKSNGFEKGFNTVNYKMQKPMSSYLVMLAIGKFKKQATTSKSGTTLEFYLDRNDSLKFEPTYRYSKQIFDFLEGEIGVKYPWKVYRQVPVRDFLYAGMENTTSTIFSQDFVVDAIGFNDKKYLNVNAHELAHQWFGDLITAKEGKHHWLQEGFATYYAMLAEKEVFGEDYFYNDLYTMAKTLNVASKHDTIPILNEKASSLTFYKKGAWALHVLRMNIGENDFRKAVKSYLKKYAYQNVNTDDFLDEIKKVSDYDVTSFKKRWLESSVFQWDEAMTLLTKSEFIKQFVQVENFEPISYPEKKTQLENLFKQATYFPIQQEILYQLEAIPFEEKMIFVNEALRSNDIKIRQALIETTPNIPITYKEQFENLLKDDSYITREIALYRLWSNFPEERTKYVALSEDWDGLNYNLKLAHLTLKLATFKEDLNVRKEVIQELESLTKLPYEATVRQNAIETLLQTGTISDAVLLSLIDLSIHHKWQAVKFAKDTMRGLLKSPLIKNQLAAIKSMADPIQQERIDYFLNE
jgi:aminopeptidase N